MRGRKNPPLDLTPEPDGAPLTFDTMARAYLEDYVLQRYRTLNTARPRVEHLRDFFGGWPAEALTPDSVRNYQLCRRKQGAEAATINRETSALSRMFQLAIRRGQMERMPLFPKRLEENPPRDGFFEHAEYLKVRTQLPASF
jgi:site-specific recombinase XerD